MSVPDLGGYTEPVGVIPRRDSWDRAAVARMYHPARAARIRVPEHITPFGGATTLPTAQQVVKHFTYRGARSALPDEWVSGWATGGTSPRFFCREAPSEWRSPRPARIPAAWVAGVARSVVMDFATDEGLGHVAPVVVVDGPSPFKGRRAWGIEQAKNARLMLRVKLRADGSLRVLHEGISPRPGYQWAAVPVDILRACRVLSMDVHRVEFGRDALPGDNLSPWCTPGDARAQQC